MTRVGIGYDIHALRRGRPFVLGGVRIPFPKGPVGHSDGDALIHALVDAVLGAMGEGDIGDHFPDSEKRWKGADSALFVHEVRRLLKKRHFKIVHLDSVVLIEAPRLAPYKIKIRRHLAGLFGLPLSAVSVKAKTNEGFGAVGKNQAVACYAIAGLRS